jgi:DNA repair exonuclease SbcCD nuclease subunit
MRFILTSDWHISDTKPEYRTDKDYLKTIFKKLKWIILKAKKHNAEFIIQAGDVFENFKPPYYIVNKLINLLEENKIILLTIPGQHDQRYHTTDLDNVTMGLMKHSPFIHILDRQPYVAFDEAGNRVNIYGAGWNSRIPKIWNKEAFNILVTHRMIVDEKLWEGQESFVYSRIFLRTSKYDLTLSGDNHKTFEIIGKEKSLINCGSLMRTRTNQKDHKPCIWILDTDKCKSNMKKGLKQLFIPVKKIENTMDLEQSKIDKNKNKKLDEYIAELKNTKTECMMLKQGLLILLMNANQRTNDG